MDTAIDFDLMQAGAAPSGWVCGVTGKGAPRWTIEADPTAPSKPNVLRQSGSGTFPWCVLPDARAENGFVEAKMKSPSGCEEFPGAKISVLFDGVVRIEMEDRHIAGPGGVGVWTKADSVTSFDDFRWGSR